MKTVITKIRDIVLPQRHENNQVALGSLRERAEAAWNTNKERIINGEKYVEDRFNARDVKSVRRLLRRYLGIQENEGIAIQNEVKLDDIYFSYKELWHEGIRYEVLYARVPCTEPGCLASVVSKGIINRDMVGLGRFLVGDYHQRHIHKFLDTK